MLRFITNGKQIHMNSTISQSFPTILADEKRLIQILFNLLHNAIKYTDAGSIEISAHIEKNMAVILIHDTGLGMMIRFKVGYFPHTSREAKMMMELGLVY